MDIQLDTAAEKEAQKAETLPAFGGLNLLHIKRQVSVLLGLIGTDGIFDDYTKHDISHVDAMLRVLDWLVPDPTKRAMTPADWVVVVLAVYFHDLGMLVTPAEFEARARSAFPAFVEGTLYKDSQGKDYRARVEGLPDDEAQRFLYQEFVRDNHPTRIREWILGKAGDALGVTDRAAEEVARLLSSLRPEVRKDLGTICESHHLDDLYDLRKYPPSRPYGNTPRGSEPPVCGRPPAGRRLAAHHRGSRPLDRLPSA